MNRQEFLKAFNTDSLVDILKNFPTRYEDLNPTPFTLEPLDSQRYIYKGKPFNVKEARNANIIRFDLKTSNQVASCMVFNQSYYIQKLRSGEDVLCVLYYSESRHVYVVNAIYSLDSFYVCSGIKPVYSLPKSVSTSYFTSFLKKELASPTSNRFDITSPLPSKYIKKYKLADEYTALRHVHFPMDKNELEKGLRVFKYEEALSYCTDALLIRKQADETKKQAFRIDHQMLRDFIHTLSYPLTDDQKYAVKDILSDMESERVMFRMLQGDVGTGKTIVSFIACYINTLRGRQSAFLAPTYELAKQHYENAKKVFASYQIKIAFLSGSSTIKEKREILNGLVSGDIDILISTHAALSEKVSFFSLGLVIIDEQQLFGVEQREELLKKGDGADMLMMSATPIPRTLSQIINADMEVSQLLSFPSGRRNVTTKVIRSTDPALFKSVNRALEINRQVFVVAPKIEEGNRKAASVNEIYQEYVSRFGSDNCQLLHGRMKKEDRDIIYQNFLSGKKPILISTTVIEVGIDVSRACLLIVYDANYFGLSTLHQLRGRIGRSGEGALSLLIYDGSDKKSKEKLEFLALHSDGLKVAEFDLKQRGSGSYGGENQSGRSELRVCNFVEDQKMFAIAKEDAKEIIQNQDEPENKRFLEYLKARKKTLVV